MKLCKNCRYYYEKKEIEGCTEQLCAHNLANIDPVLGGEMPVAHSADYLRYNKNYCGLKAKWYKGMKKSKKKTNNCKKECFGLGFNVM